MQLVLTLSPIHQSDEVPPSLQTFLDKKQRAYPRSRQITPSHSSPTAPSVVQYVYRVPLYET
jgi:hypothetical protein